MSHYTLTVVDMNGKAHTTTTDGYYAESMADQFFNEAIKDSRCIFAIVCDDVMPLTPRRHYIKPKGDPVDGQA